MKKSKILLLILSSTMFIAACNSESKDNTTIAATTDSASFDMSKAKSVIADINAKFGEEMRKGDSVAMASHYASDALVMPPNGNL